MSLNVPHFKSVQGDRPMIMSHTKENLAQFRFSQFYINEGDEDIFVTLRNNLPVRIKSNEGGYRNSSNFIIRNVYVFQNIHIINDTINNITKIKKNYPNSSNDLDVIKDVLLQRVKGEFSAYCEVVIDRNFDLMELSDYGNTYIPECDTLLSYKTLDLSCPHPFSNEGSSINNYLQNSYRYRSSATLCIDIVDNENNIDKRYLYVAKSLIELKTIKDDTRSSGVYFTVAKDDGTDNPQLTTNNYPISDLEEKLGIYSTKEEAMTGGDPNEVHKRIMLGLQQENEILKATNTKNEQETTAELLRLKEEADKRHLDLERIKKEYAFQAEEIARQKSEREDIYSKKKHEREDYYSERSHSRKDDSEFFKYVPLLAAAAAGTYMAFRQSK